MLPAVDADEQLARFILFSKWTRGDQTVRADAFVPHPYTDLSTTRHLNLTETELWLVGAQVAEMRPATLYGRADILAAVPLSRKLRLVPTTEPRNHVNICGWPSDKPAQKIIAQELAAGARFTPAPPRNRH